MTGWDEALEGWQAWCRMAGHREATIAQRTYDLRMIGRLVGVDPWDVTLGDLVRVLGRPGWAPETRRGYRGALRSFYSYALDCEHVVTDPTRKLPKVRPPETAPRPAPDRVLLNALSSCTDRDRLILMLAAHAGLRRSEIAGLRWEHVGDTALRVYGKGGKVRVVPLLPALAAELETERERRDAGRFGSGYRYTGHPEAPFVFPGRYGRGETAEAIGRTATRVLGGGWTAHTLRHRFATLAYSADRDLLAVQALLGHAKPETTRRYARLPAGALERAVAAAGGAS